MRWKHQERETQTEQGETLRLSREREEYLCSCLGGLLDEVASVLPSSSAEEGSPSRISELQAFLADKGRPPPPKEAREESIAALSALLRDYRKEVSALSDDDAVLRYQLRESIGLLKRMTATSSHYSEEAVREILDGFKGIAVSSDRLGKEIAEGTRALLNESDASSLAAITRESRAVFAELERLIRDLDELKSYMGKIRATTASQFERIKQMAQGVEEFSETIRIITLNLNVEAARLSGASSIQAARNSGKSFQVLAKNMSEFASKAQDLSRDERNIIDGAIASLMNVNQTFLSSLEELLRRIPEMRGRMEPFEGIVARSGEQLARSIDGLESMSSTIDRELKDIIGRFQFQDLSRQESEHFAKFLETTLLSRSYESNVLASHLPPDRRKALLAELLKEYAGISTTINERHVIREAGAGAEISTSGMVDSDEELKDGSVKLF